MDLFEVEVALPPLTALIERAKTSIAKVFLEGRPCILAVSFGKDSSLVLALALEVAIELKARGHDPRIVVTTASTLIDNPEIDEHVRQESAKLIRYAKLHGLNLSFHVARPSMMASWQLKVLSGRGLPAYPGQNSDCSIDLKITPQKVLRSKLFAQYRKAGLPDPVTCLGTRFSESERRALKMRLRQESADAPVQNKAGEWTLSPIADFSNDDVWEFISMVSSGERKSYSDWDDLIRIYADAGGTSCAVVSDAILDGIGKKAKGGCGARTGCFTCQLAYDKSLRSMVEGESRYAYARGLVRFNEYLRAIRWDWTRRHWIGRTISEGYLCVQPDTFHPTEVRRQARFLMQLDFDEQCRASREGGRPKFEILPLEMLIAIDCFWSINGLAKPFAIWADRQMIRSGIRFDIPDVPAVPETKIPDARFLFVGDQKHSVWEGLRDAYTEGILGESNCAPVIADDGLWELETGIAFRVDPEGADLLEQFEVPYLLERYREKVPPGGITSGFKHYLGLGTIEVSHSQRKSIDEALRRTALKDRLGLTLDYKIEDVLAQSCRYADMPPAARAAWKHKATTANSQPELELI